MRRTWTRGNNADFLGRIAKLAARRKWAPLVAAFRTALRKVRDLHLVISLLDTLAGLLDLRMRRPSERQSIEYSGTRDVSIAVVKNVHLAQVEAGAGAQGAAAEAAAGSEGAERPQKRARLKGGKAGAAVGAQSGSKPRAADVVSPAMLREWHRFAEQLAAAERAAQAAEVWAASQHSIEPSVLQCTRKTCSP